tara:strand:- start:1468 stop:2835 length:1368 start_codon:yes stop_codon:yes gene_type:complete
MRRAALTLLLASASAYVVAPPALAAARGGLHQQPLRLPTLRRAEQPAQMLLAEAPSVLPSLLLSMEMEMDNSLVAAGVVAVVAAIAFGGRTSFAGGAAIILLLLGGDPDKREESGANEMGPLQKAVLSVTPSAWKKAYLGDNDVERGEVALLDLPAWQGEQARELVEEEAVACVKSMQLADIEVPGVGPVPSCFISQAPAELADAPPVMLIHGFDSSVLEFRYVVPALLEAGLRVEAMEWWTGGFTAREPFLRKIEEGAAPWDLIAEHQYAFWKRQLNGQKVVLLGASLGGAVAMDFAKRHPECVEALILMDAGGESYAQPGPFLSSLAADAVTNLFQWRATNGLLPYPHLWAPEDAWRQSLRAFFKSGGYQVQVNQEFVKTVPQPTLVLWGEEDDVLPVEDAYKYQADLPNCVGVTLVPDAQHAPALENAPFVAQQIIDFTKSKVWEKQPAVAA